MNRRSFVALGAGTVTGAVNAAPQLALNGGTPVRSSPLRGMNWGPLHYDEAERNQLAEVVETKRPFRFMANADKAATFERELAALMGVPYALAVTSGTAALECAVAGLGIGPGDEVILPAWTWHATCTAVIRAGALPVFAEIDETLNIDPSDIEHRITPQTKAIFAVHLLGGQADLDPVLAIARKHRLKVLEDCAQAVGASYKGRRLGTIGDVGIFSHQESKTITSGEGGSLITSDPVIFERACHFHDTGRPLNRPHEKMLGGSKNLSFAGTNFRMSEFTGAVMLAQVRKLDRIINAARGKAALVYQGIRDLPGVKLRKRPDPAGDLGSPVFIEFSSKELRDKYVEAMTAENVPARPPGGSAILPIARYIENKIAAHPAWPTWTSERGKAIRYGAASCPRTIDILNRFAGVAVGPRYTRQDVDDIVTAIRKVYPKLVQA